jgi:hypothetical protein
MDGEITLGGLHMIHERSRLKICGPIMAQGGIDNFQYLNFSFCIKTYLLSGSFHFLFFGQSDQNTKKSLVILLQNADFLYRKQQTGQLLFSFLVTLTKKQKME